MELANEGFVATPSYRAGDHPGHVPTVAIPDAASNARLLVVRFDNDQLMILDVISILGSARQHRQFEVVSLDDL